MVGQVLLLAHLFDFVNSLDLPLCGQVALIADDVDDRIAASRVPYEVDPLAEGFGSQVV